MSRAIYSAAELLQQPVHVELAAVRDEHVALKAVDMDTGRPKPWHPSARYPGIRRCGCPTNRHRETAVRTVDEDLVDYMATVGKGR